MKRESGILLHITSLDGKYGIGTLGNESYRFVDFLKKSAIKIWQVLPLVPTSFGNSPYQSYSAFAGNPLLINLDELIEMELLQIEDLAPMAIEIESFYIDYSSVEKTKIPLLQKAFQKFIVKKEYSEDFRSFCMQNSFWLDDFSLFMAFKEYYNQAPLNLWDKTIKKREKSTMEYYSQRLKSSVEYYKFVQFIFFKQWNSLKKYAQQKGIKIMGDIPIYVSLDSADVWSNPELFQLDSELKPEFVAGVPPDYFSKTGQLWGNPLYNWEANKLEDYQWWFSRIRFHFEMFDMVRIDHFRAFSKYWSIPYIEETAINGNWETAPGYDFFKTLELNHGKLNIIAEDLGIITPDVEELRDAFSFPGMKILQFAFDKDSKNAYLPHNYDSNFVVYTGTHDNDTTLGWWQTLSEDQQQYILEYLGKSSDSITWSLIRLAWSSIARIAIVPMQDLLNLDSKHRMNVPGTCEHNWRWKMTASQLNQDLRDRILKMNTIYNRVS